MQQERRDCRSGLFFGIRIMLQITLESPPLGGARSKGGLQFTAAALEQNLALADEVTKAALLEAIQEASDETRAFAIDRLGAEVRCDRQLISDRIKSYPVTANKPLGTIVVLRKPIDLRHFRPQQNGKGVTVRTTRGRSKFYRHAFGPNIKRLGGNVFLRRTKERLPIVKIRGVSLVTVAQSRGIDEELRVKFQYLARVKMKRNLVKAAIGVFRSAA